MVRRVTPAQAQAALRRAQQQIRQAQQKQRQALQSYNADVRRVNAHNQRVVDDHNRKVRAHKARLRTNQQRLRAEIARLQRQPPVRYLVTQRSTMTLHRMFTAMEEASEREAWGPGAATLLDGAEGEAANSAKVVNALLDQGERPAPEAGTLMETSIADELSQFSEDLDNRWRGALFALHPRNPDAARHFCTSCREVLTGMIEASAPDQAVLAAMPECERTEAGRPVRRAKIRYLLDRRRLAHDRLEDFVIRDIDDVLGLFPAFNSATHGVAGTFSLAQLGALKTRVEGAIQFLALVAQAA